MTELIAVKIQKLDEANRNGRIYSTEAVQEALDKIDQRHVFGTIGYPNTGTYIQDNTGIPLHEVSHMANNLRIEDGYLVGDIKVLETPKGNILSQLIEDGVETAFRTLGYANVDADGQVRDFTLTGVVLVPADSAA